MRARRLLVRAGLALLAATGGLLATGVGALLLLSTGPGNELVRRVALPRLQALVPRGSLALERLSFNLVSELELGGVALRDAEGRELIGFDRLHLSYDLRGLLRRELAVELSLERPRVDLRALPDGRLDLVHALDLPPSPAEQAPGAPWAGLPGALDLQALTIIDADIHYEASGLDLQVSELDLEATGFARGRVARLSGLRAEGQLVRPAALPLSLEGGLAYVEGDAELDGLALMLGGSRLGLEGRAEAVETRPDLDLDVDLALWPADLQALLAAEEPLLIAPVEARAELDGPLSALRAGLELGGPAGSARLEASADLEASPVAWRLSLDTAGYELSRLLAPVSARTRLATRAELSGTGTRWPASPGETGADLIRGEIRLEGDDQVLWGEPVRALRLDASVDAGALEIRRLSGRHAVGGLSASGRVDVPAGKADLRAQIGLPDLALLARYGVDGLGGSARYEGRLRADWSGERAAVEATGALHGEGLRGPGGVGVATLEAPLEASLLGGAVEARGALTLTGLALPGGGAEQAQLGFAVSRAESGALRVRLDNLVVAGAASEDGRSALAELRGGVTGGLTAGGAPWGELDLQLSGLSLPTGVAGSGPIRASLADDRVTLSADLQGGTGPLLVVELQGDLEGGAWSAPTLALGPLPGTTWTATEPVTWTLESDGLSGLHLALQSAAGGLSVDGALRGSGVDAALGVEELDLAWVAELARRLDPETPLAGLRGRSSLEATLRAAEATAPVAALTLSLRGVEQEGRTAAPLDLELEAALGADTLRLDGALRRERRSWLALGGEIPLRVRALEGEVALPCGEELVARALLGPLSGRALAAVIPEAEGRFEQAALDLSLTGDVCDPEIALAASGSVYDEDLGRTLRADLDLARAGGTLTLTGGVEMDLARRLQVDGTARTGLSEVLGWALRGEARPTLGAPATWVTDLELNVVPLGVPLAMLGAPETFGGSLTGGAQLSGPIEDLELAGGLQWTAGRIGNVDLNLGYLGLVPEGEGYALTALLGFVDGGGLAVEGFVPFSLDLAGDLSLGLEAALADERLNLRVSDGQGGHARVPLAVLTGAAEGLSEPEGELELWGAVTGALASPAPDLQLRLLGGGLTVDSTRVRYEDLALDAELGQDRVLVRELSMASLPRYGGAIRKGALRVDGQIGLEDHGLGGVSLDAVLEDFTASATEEMGLVASGEIKARGPWPDVLLTGELALGNTRIARTRDDFLSSASLSLSPDIVLFRGGEQVRARGAGQRPEIWERLRLRLDLALQRNLRLDIELPTQADYGEQFAALSSVKLDAEFDGDLRVEGTAGAPVLEGTIETVRGTVDLLNASFDLESGGAINFVGGDYDNPILDLRAVRRTAEYGDVNVDITQDVDHIKVDFSADQYPDPSDALSLVVFGVPTSQLTDKEGGMGMQLWALARSGLSGQFERAVGLSAVDEFEIDPSSGAVRVGKALSDRLFLSVEQRFSTEDEAENLTEATVEWLIMRQLYADFVTGDAGKSSADIYWRWRF